MGAMDLDRDLGQASFGRNLLVHEAGRDQAHHLAFARTERFVTGPKSRNGAFLLAALTIAFERDAHRIKEVLLAEWLGQKLDRSGLHGFDRHRNVAMAGDEYD